MRDTKPDQTSQNRELMNLEQRYWQAIKDGDTETCLRLTDAPCIVAGAQGVATLDEKTFAEMAKKPLYTVEKFELSDMHVRLITPDTAIIGYKVHEELTVEGKPIMLDAVDTSTWVRRADGWRCALHAEALVGDPFGRDQAPARS